MIIIFYNTGAQWPIEFYQIRTLFLSGKGMQITEKMTYESDYTCMFAENISQKTLVVSRCPFFDFKQYSINK